MKQYLLATALSVLPFAANAADLPVRAPAYVPAPPPPYSWTGFYLGVSGGFIAQHTRGTDLGPAGACDGVFGPVCGDKYSASGIGGIFGGYVGYNWQLAPNWVFGIEADISGTAVKGDTTFTNPDNDLTQVVESKLTALGTVRGRIGYAFDRALLYATGGWAYGKVQNHAIRLGGSPDKDVTTDGWKSGWTAGGGLEYAILNNWTVRVEALYVDLGSKEGIGPLPCGCRFGFKNKYAIGRVGVNYKF